MRTTVSELSQTCAQQTKHDHIVNAKLQKESKTRSQSERTNRKWTIKHTLSPVGSLNERVDNCRAVTILEQSPQNRVVLNYLLSYSVGFFVCLTNLDVFPKGIWSNCLFSFTAKNAMETAHSCIPIDAQNGCKASCKYRIRCAKVFAFLKQTIKRRNIKRYKDPRLV